MMLSRAKPAVGRGVQPTDKRKKKGRKIPKLEELLSKRDFTGAITLLEFKRHVGEEEEDTNLWIGYCAFHLGDYKRALEEYENATKEENCNSEVWVNLACTYFFLGMYKQAEAAGFKASKSRLQNRLLFHLAHKFNDEKKLMSFHQNLQDVTEDQLSLASIHYMRSHYQEAIDIYKRILLDNREYLALNVYVALCYYKLDYYDVSQEVLAVYLQQIPDSTIALNLKACNHFRLYNGRAAEVLSVQSFYCKYYHILSLTQMGQFYYSAKAFDVLERLDPNPEYWEGKRGACVGIFQMIVAGREPKETLREVLHLLRSTGNTQVEYMIRIMKKWAKENRVPI
ncbi:intraflagellar transport protein 56 [Piliocolobus tephrosceles]|uniref:intraflagellar transport protein 56 n=1 Tax=Piliocolobus tephrosceles TaxID=591936 RepID=UPI000E6AF291|nr:intraflagellar transport protein 56 [Piliocolobus tephrosceles]